MKTRGGLRRRRLWPAAFWPPPRLSSAGAVTFTYCGARDAGAGRESGTGVTRLSTKDRRISGGQPGAAGPRPGPMAGLLSTEVVTCYAAVTYSHDGRSMYSAAQRTYPTPASSPRCPATAGDLAYYSNPEQRMVGLADAGDRSTSRIWSPA